MLTSLQIGQNGRLGNQMFQYAALATAAFTRGYDWSLQKNESVDLWKVFNMDDVEVLKQEDVNKLKFVYQEPDFQFHPSLFLVDDFTDLRGYFQSPIYFGNCFEIIKSAFTFKEDINFTAMFEMQKYFDGRPMCSLHVRRGDYLEKSNYHPPCSLDYYNKSKDEIIRAAKGNVKFLLFGDDHQWIRDNLVDENSVLVEGNSPEVDMCMMSKCAAHIISNSSFSWWGAVLGNFQSVIAPRVWFGPEGPKKWNTIYIQNWGLI